MPSDDFVLDLESLDWLFIIKCGLPKCALFTLFGFKYSLAHLIFVL